MINDLKFLGSQTAKNGFRNEDDIVSKFNNWAIDEDSQKWLVIMGYEIKKIEYVHAIKMSGEKTDVQVQITIKLKDALDVENLQVKLVSNLRGFNQIDKRWVSKYTELWDIPIELTTMLKKFTGEISPTINNPRDRRRMFINEFEDIEINKLLNFLNANKSLIVNDILKGRGKFSAEWILVVQKILKNSRWVLKPMNIAINYYGNGEIKITDRGSIKIGKITIQRKGGDSGRNTANMLQFKINPAELFNL